MRSMAIKVNRPDAKEWQLWIKVIGITEWRMLGFYSTYDEAVAAVPTTGDEARDLESTRITRVKVWY